MRDMRRVKDIKNHHSGLLAYVRPLATELSVCSDLQEKE